MVRVFLQSLLDPSGWRLKYFATACTALLACTFSACGVDSEAKGPDTSVDAGSDTGLVDSGADARMDATQPKPCVPDDDEKDEETTCDERDNDCDGKVDEGLGETFYRDADDDKKGTPDKTIIACEKPDGYVAEAGDCDDGNGDEQGGANEACNGSDDDCDAKIDEGRPCSGDCLGKTYDGHAYQMCAYNIASNRDGNVAANQCNSLGGGKYKLVEIGDRAENEWLSKNTGIPDRSWWIGLKYTEDGWRWRSDENTEPTYTNWKVGEPNGNGSEKCAEFRPNDGTWNDKSCSEVTGLLFLAGHICEQK